MRRHALPPLILLGLAVLSACGQDQTETTSGDATSSATPSATESVEPTPTEPTDAASPTDEATAEEPPVTSLVYYLVDDPMGLRIAREPHQLPAQDTVAAAVADMIAGPADPDYATTWNPDTKVLGIRQQGDVVTVDLSADARDLVGGDDAALRMVQQLIYTVTEITGADTKVLLLVEGKKAGDLWNSLTWTKPIGRDAPMAVRNLVQIDFPAEGGTSGTKLSVSGEAATSEANVSWQVVDSSGAVVRKGFTTAQEGMTLSPYSFTVKLEPGTYTVQVSEDDASGGEGQPPRTDTRTVTIG